LTLTSTPGGLENQNKGSQDFPLLILLKPAL